MSMLFYVLISPCSSARLKRKSGTRRWHVQIRSATKMKWLDIRDIQHMQVLERPLILWIMEKYDRCCEGQSSSFPARLPPRHEHLAENVMGQVLESFTLRKELEKVHSSRRAPDISKGRHKQLFISVSSTGPT